MIKALIRPQGDLKETTILLGITRKNVEELMKGRPIHIKGAQLGIETAVIIMWGEDERQLLADLKKSGLQLPDVPFIGKGKP